MATKLRNIPEDGRETKLLTNIFRHGAVKAVSFILFVACVTAITVTGGLFARDWTGGGSAEDYLAGRSFEESTFLYWKTNQLAITVSYTAGWNAQNEADAEFLQNQYRPETGALDGALYYVRTPFVELFNNDMTEQDYRRQRVWFLQFDHRTERSSGPSRPFWYNLNTPSHAESGDYELRLALTYDYTASLAAEYADNERVFWKYTYTLASLCLGVLLCLLHLLLVCGRKPNSGEKHLSVWDKPWLDVSLAAILTCSAGVILLLEMLFRNGIPTAGYTRFLAYIGVIAAVSSALALWWLLCAMKRLKTLTILKHTLTYTVLALAFRILRRAARFIISPVARFFRSVYLWMPLKAQLLLGKAEHFDAVAQGLDRLAQGDYQTPVEENGRGALLRMAQNVNAATDGLKSAVEKELTSQRFKAELITNVSHDLRTPLTSVITYADLLQSEGLTSPNAEKYLEIIQQKGRRLQTMTEDLFETAKASSGETKAVLAPLDINQLIGQTLGEMGDRLSAANLDVRVSGSGGTAMADARLLCRVLENLLRNIEKYAMPGTRVYVDMRAGDGLSVTTLRNISQAPLDGEAERLAERFTRGDDARSSEGSGLGLAIVKSFMELQKGTCAIAVDGDLFKVTLTLPLA
ncbi:MAG: HAMP domain-containing histidine kinase [Oscillospiraceae bacterium]|nr:HAMP domain-containing histidine kinase [Oscillospiraceae bacterium]